MDAYFFITAICLSRGFKWLSIHLVVGRPGFEPFDSLAESDQKTVKVGTGIYSFPT